MALTVMYLAAVAAQTLGVLVGGWVAGAAFAQRSRHFLPAVYTGLFLQVTALIYLVLAASAWPQRAPDWTAAIPGVQVVVVAGYAAFVYVRSRRPVDPADLSDPHAGHGWDCEDCRRLYAKAADYRVGLCLLCGVQHWPWQPHAEHQVAGPPS